MEEPKEPAESAEPAPQPNQYLPTRELQLSQKPHTEEVTFVGPVEADPQTIQKLEKVLGTDPLPDGVSEIKFDIRRLWLRIRVTDKSLQAIVDALSISTGVEYAKIGARAVVDIVRAVFASGSKPKRKKRPKRH
jgi:hypothetical protein